MSDSHIQLVRIDDRFIHAPVSTQWVGALGANSILVANDEVAVDPMRKGIMDMAAPANVKTIYLPVAQAVEALSKAAVDKRVLVLVGSPADALALVKGGVKIEKINVGNMAAIAGKRAVTPVISVDDDDAAAFRALRDAGIEVEIQRIPSVPPEDASGLFE